MAETALAGNVETVEGKHGEKMIEVRARFWTNEIAEEEGHVRPRHAWSSGMVLMQRNETHGIAPKEPKPFESLAHLPHVIEEVLVEHGIKLHTSRHERRYRAD